MSWTTHATDHLQQNGKVGQLPLKCRMTYFRNNIIRAFLCPECLGEGKFYQIMNSTEWKDHLIYHLSMEAPAPWSCGHPRCTRVGAMSQLDAYFCHLGELDTWQTEVEAAGCAMFCKSLDHNQIWDETRHRRLRDLHCRLPETTPPESRSQEACTATVTSGYRKPQIVNKHSREEATCLELRSRRNPNDGVGIR
jgi:hypothetical protein